MPRRTITGWALAAMIAVFLIGAGFVPSAQKRRQVLSRNPGAGIRLLVKRIQRDKKGTDVSNAYRFTVDRRGPFLEFPGPFLVLYYENDTFLEEFRDQSLPFSFQRSFKGREKGTVAVRVDIEDGADNVLATARKAVRVR